jgi:hypothetical protein
VSGYITGRPTVLNAVDAGITRLRSKGGASPKSLYDLVDAYVTAGKTILPRPGSRRVASLPPGSIGLTLYEGEFHVYASSNIGAMPAGYHLNILIHPTNAGASLRYIWAAFPYLGHLYVVAEWSTGEVFHYWLEKRAAWQASTVYREGDIVEPTVPNGFAYQATRMNPAAPAWAPNVPRALNDRVAPTTSNGYEYVVVDVQGANPKSGAVEPTWPTADGAQVIEDTDLGTAPPTSGDDGDGAPPLPSDVEDRYDNAPWGVRTQPR